MASVLGPRISRRPLRTPLASTAFFACRPISRVADRAITLVEASQSELPGTRCGVLPRADRDKSCLPRIYPTRGWIELPRGSVGKCTPFSAGWTESVRTAQVRASKRSSEAARKGVEQERQSGRAEACRLQFDRQKEERIKRMLLVAMLELRLRGALSV